MRRFEKKIKIAELNKRLNKKGNSLTENFRPGEGSEREYYDFILQGEFYTDEDALEHAQGQDWGSMEITPQNLPNVGYIDTVNGVEIYKDYGADYYVFSPAEEESIEEEFEDNRNDYDYDQRPNNYDFKVPTEDDDINETSPEKALGAAKKMWQDQIGGDGHENLRAQKLLKTYGEKLKGAPLFNGQIDYVEVKLIRNQKDNKNEHAVSQLVIFIHSNFNVGIFYNYSIDQFMDGATAETVEPLSRPITKAHARELYKIAAHFNPKTRYVNYTRELNIKVDESITEDDIADFHKYHGAFNESINYDNSMGKEYSPDMEFRFQYPEQPPENLPNSFDGLMQMALDNSNSNKYLVDATHYVMKLIALRNKSGHDENVYNQVKNHVRNYGKKVGANLRESKGNNLGETNKSKSLNVMSEASQKVFDELCGVKLIKESIHDNPITSNNDTGNEISPEEAKQILSVLTPLLENYTPDYKNKFLSVETDSITGAPMGLLFEMNNVGGEGNNYSLEIGFDGRITHIEPIDQGDRWTPPGGGEVEFDVWATAGVYLVDGTEIPSDDGRPRYRNADIIIKDAALAKSLFNPDLIYGISDISERVEELLMENSNDDGPDGDDYGDGGGGSSWVQGYNKYGTDFNPGRDR